MKNIDLSELDRILKLKNKYDSGDIDIDMISPQDYEVMNLLYKSELNEKNSEIKKIRDEINEIYTLMEEVVNNNENKE